MHFILGLFLAFAILLGTSNTSLARDAKQICSHQRGVQQIRGCTEVIQTAKRDKGSISQIGLAIAYSNRGVAHNALGNFEQAISDFNASLKYRPNSARTYFNLGNVYRQLKATPRAIKMYDKAIQLNPQAADYFNNRGLALNKIGLLDEALKDFTSAIKIEPNDATFYNNRGGILSKLLRHHEAITDFSKAISIRPNYRSARLNRAASYRAIGKTNAAKDDERVGAPSRNKKHQFIPPQKTLPNR